MNYDTTLTNFFEKVCVEDMDAKVNPLLPENIEETSRYVLSWEKGSHINLVTFLWDAKLKKWKNITRSDKSLSSERFTYYPVELARSGMCIVEKVEMDYFVHDKTLLWGEKEVGIDAGNW